MTRDAGVLRDASSLRVATAALAAVPVTDREVGNLLTVSEALVHAALAREESRGTHFRVDFPDTEPAMLGRFVFRTAPTPEFVHLPEFVATR